MGENQFERDVMLLIDTLSNNESVIFRKIKGYKYYVVPMPNYQGIRIIGLGTITDKNKVDIIELWTEKDSKISPLTKSGAYGKLLNIISHLNICIFLDQKKKES